MKNLDNKYIISKKDDTPLHPNSKYFVLRYDKDKNARLALKEYIRLLKADPNGDFKLAKGLEDSIMPYEMLDDAKARQSIDTVDLLKESLESKIQKLIDEGKLVSFEKFKPLKEDTLKSEEFIKGLKSSILSSISPKFIITDKKDFKLIKKSKLINDVLSTSANLSAEMIQSLSQVGIDAYAQIESVLLNESIRGIYNKIFISFRDLKYDSISKLRFLSLLDKADCDYLICNTLIGSILQDESDFFVNALSGELNNSFEIPYEIGSYKDIKILIDPYLEWSNHKVFLIKDKISYVNLDNIKYQTIAELTRSPKVSLKGIDISIFNVDKNISVYEVKELENNI